MSMITADPRDVPHVAHFAFTPEHLAKAKELIANYPPGRQASAVIGILDLAQRQQGWLPRVAMDEVAKLLDMAPIRVYEIATFYTMFQLRPRGKPAPSSVPSKPAARTSPSTRSYGTCGRRSGRSSLFQVIGEKPGLRGIAHCPTS